MLDGKRRDLRRCKLKITILNHEGDVLLATRDEKISEETRKFKTVKEMSYGEIQHEFDKLMSENRIAIDDDRNKIIKTLNHKTQNITILNPQIGG